MNYKERIYAGLTGGASDELPVCPRLDLWYNANKRKETLPREYRDATLFQIIEDLDIGYNTTIPDFRDKEKPEDEAFRALGLFQCNDIFYSLSFDMDVRMKNLGDEFITEYHTPHGTITTKSLHSEKMKEDGVTVSHISEKAFKSASDYEALCYIFDSAVVTPRYDRISRMEEAVGDRGVPIGWVTSTASPMHFVQKQLMGFEQFFFEMFDHTEELERLTRAIGGMEDKIFNVMLEAPIDVYRMGGNYDSMMQNPPFFRDYITPNLKKRSRKLHEAGKVLTSHTDGENDGLLEEYLNCEIDMAESLCPAPMTRLSVRDIRKAFDGRIGIWGGIPSLMMLPESYTEKEYDAYLKDFFESIGDGNNMIISIADTVPPEADFNRIKKLIREAKNFGPVPGRKKSMMPA